MVELRELSHKAQMVLETYEMEVECKKRKLDRFLGRVGVHNLDGEIKDIRSRLTKLIKDFPSMEAAGSSNSALDLHQSRITYSHEPVQYFVGMVKDIDSLVTMVEDDSPDSPLVISICGMGGLGKTTLAREVYNHRDIRARFEGRAWVCITQQLQLETILRDIFQQIVGEEPDKDKPLDRLVRELNKVLVQRKSLIVIDDIWKTRHWEILKKAFPRENCKVVLTTRNKKIASRDKRCHLYKLGFLTEDEGWELLSKIALPHGQVREDISKSVEDVGRKMVQKCGGLPLAISVIGGVLRQKNRRFDWEEVSRNMDAYLKNGGDGIDDDDDTRVTLVLDLSFNALPYYLKLCFLYLTCFPEDHDIDTEQLYLLWLAEGFISLEDRGKNESLMDVAERYLCELAFRCMVQVEKASFTSPFKKFTSCRLHDLMRDLCSSKARDEKFVKRVDISTTQHDTPLVIEASIHKLAINVFDNPTLSQKCLLQEIKDLKSLLVLYKRVIDFQNLVNFEKSKHLRILLLGGAQFKGRNLLPLVEENFLVYLSFRGCKVEGGLPLELQKDLFNLPLLQTFDMRMNSPIKLPNLIRKMKKLRHLFLPEFIQVIGGGKLRLDGLNELETLEGFDSENACTNDICTLTNLWKLSGKISGFDDDVDISKVMDFMRRQLRETDIAFWFCDLRNVLDGLLTMHSLFRLEVKYVPYMCACDFPSYKPNMCQNLVKLDIMCFKFGPDVMEGLGKYPMLEYLSVRAESEEPMTEMRFQADSFPELKYLALLSFKNLYKWEVEKGAVPKLRELLILSCINLEKLPEELSSTLQILECGHMSKFKNRMRGGQDYANFSNIPHVRIY